MTVIEELGGTFHRSNTRNTSIIDLVFATHFKTLHWRDWRYTESTGSDHEAIVYSTTISGHYKFTKLQEPRYNIKKANWQKFEQNLRSLEYPIGQQLDLDIASHNFDSIASHLHSLLYQAAKDSIPRMRVSSHSKPWWTKELTELRQKYHSLRRKGKKSLDPVHIEEARLARNVYFRKISLTKHEHWHQFLSDAKDKSLFTAFKYSDPQRYQSPLIPTLQYKSENDRSMKVATSFGEKCEALVSSLFPTLSAPPQPSLNHAESIPSPTPISSSSYPRSHQKFTQWQWPELSLNELLQAIPNKITAPGYDNITWTMIQKSVNILPTLFLKAFKALMNSGYHPQLWKEAIGIILPKRNKKDYTDPQAYRPISLLPCLSKLLEKLFANRLSYYANITDNLLHYSQMGGRKQRSAVDAALLLQNFIENNFSRQKSVSTVLLDIKGAFDRLHTGKLIKTLESLQLPSTLISWVNSFLSGRTIRLSFNSQLSTSYPACGTPQGSPISPILFLLSIRDLFQTEEKSNFLQLSYVDDISLSIASHSIIKNTKELFKILDTIFIKAIDLSITFDVKKTELIHFHRGRIPSTIPLKINNIITYPTEVVRYLGIWFDRKLTFSTHIDKRLQLAHGALHRLRSLASATRGPRLNELRQLYLTCVTSILDYGSILWAGKYGTKGHINKYQKLQNSALRIITGAYFGSPSKALEVEASIYPCSVRLLKLSYSYALRILKLQPTHPIQNALFSPLQDELSKTSMVDFGLLECLFENSTQITKLGMLLKKLSTQWRLERYDWSWSPPWAINTINFEIAQIPKTDAKNKHICDLQKIPQSAMVAYTDGSRSSE
ncbi:reverse transcriptase, partial [Thalictrum thalictroides]